MPMDSKGRSNENVGLKPELWAFELQTPVTSGNRHGVEVDKRPSGASDNLECTELRPKADACLVLMIDQLEYEPRAVRSDFPKEVRDLRLGVKTQILNVGNLFKHTHANIFKTWLIFPLYF